MQLSTAAEAWRERGRFVRVRGMNVFTVSDGESSLATPLLLLHGFPTSSFDWSHVWAPLAAGRRVVTLDFPGFGFSDKPASYAYSLFEQADVVEVVMRELGVVRAHLVAHDMGTSVATELVARRAAGLLHFDLDRLVLMNGSVHIDMARLTIGQKLLLRPRLGPLFAQLSSRGTFHTLMRRILARPVSVEELNDLFALIRLADGHMRLPSIVGYIRERKRFARRWIGALETFDRPALVLWGVLDPVAVFAIAEALAKETPGARLVRLDDVGHYPQLEAPDRVVAVLEAFLSGGGDTDLAAAAAAGLE